MARINCQRIRGIMNISRIVSLFALGALCVSPVMAQTKGFDTPAKQAILFDLTTNTILYEKEADVPMPPASMSKLMTTYLLLEKIKFGELPLESTTTVSRKAWKMGGSKMFIEVGKSVSIEDLLRGIIIQSGNDAAVAIAETIAGSEEAFAEMMTEKAKQIGMTGSHFANSTGWPDTQHYMTARDLAVLAQRLIVDFPEYYHYFSEKEFTYNKIKQRNRNPLLFKVPGADGLKTGHTEASGYGVVGTVERDGRRLIVVVNGLTSKRARSRESERMIEWGYRNFAMLPLFKAGDVVSDADVWLGQEKRINLVVPDNVVVAMPKRSRSKMKISAHFNSPISAPILIGQEVGYVTVAAPDFKTQKYPLIAGQGTSKLGIFDKIPAAINYLIFGASE